MMGRIVLIAVIAASVLHCYGALQVQMPEHAELLQPENDLQAQIRELQKNVTDIWTYIQNLRSAVSQHLTHLRQHQVELESSMHRMEHLHDATADSQTHGDHHGDSHHHSDEQHSHGDSHDSHSHSGEHHSHGDEHHSHSGEQHSHSGEQHSHSGEHGHHSHSHSYSSHDHSKEDGSHSHSHDHGGMSSSGHSHSHDDHSHGGDHDHKDSHETEDLQQGIQQVATDAGPVVAEPVVSATTRQEHYHHHHHDHNQGSRSSSGSSNNAMDLMNENNFHHHHHGHHHHDSSRRSSANRTVELPKYTDYGMYDFAVCSVQPNRAIPEDQQQNVGGQITLWQRKSGGPLYIHVRLQGFEMGDHHGHHGAQQGLQMEHDNETPQEEIGHKHGFHIHTYGDLSNGCQSTGPHYNPKGVNHGGPASLVRHVGDLGNIECDSNGVTNIIFSDDIASLQGQYSVIGKAMVVHSKPDDFGEGGDAESLKTGNAGTRLACCVIQRVDKLPIRYYKTMKTATQYQNHLKA